MLSSFNVKIGYPTSCKSQCDKDLDKEVDLATGTATEVYQGQRDVQKQDGEADEVKQYCSKVPN